MHDIADTKHCRDIHHIMLSLQDDSLVVKGFLFFDRKHSVFVGIFTGVSEDADMQVFEFLKLEIMLFKDFIPEKVMIASLEKVELCILVIFKSLVSIDMIGIDIDQYADVIAFFESLKHITGDLKYCIFIFLRAKVGDIEIIKDRITNIPYQLNILPRMFECFVDERRGSGFSFSAGNRDDLTLIVIKEYLRLRGDLLPIRRDFFMVKRDARRLDDQIKIF